MSEDCWEWNLGHSLTAFPALPSSSPYEDAAESQGSWKQPEATALSHHRSHSQIQLPKIPL